MKRAAAAPIAPQPQPIAEEELDRLVYSDDEEEAFDPNDDVDMMFLEQMDKEMIIEEEEGDPTDAKYAPPPPPSTAVQQKEEEDATLRAIAALPSEKMRSALMSAYLREKNPTSVVSSVAGGGGEKRAPPVEEPDKRPADPRPTKKATPPPPPPMVKVVKEPTWTSGAVPVFFPHKQDRERITSYIYANVVSLIVSKALGTDYNGAGYQVIDGAHHLFQTSIFFERYGIFRDQLLAVLPAHFQSSPTIMHIVTSMSGCKLDVSNNPKQLYPNMTEKILCAWSGTEIEAATEVRSLALVPLSCSWSHTACVEIETPLKRGVMFHVHSRYVNVLKCIHTVLFFLDYVNAEIQDQVLKLRKALPASMFDWNETSEAEWRLMFGFSPIESSLTPADKKKRQPFVALINAMQSSLAECVNVLRKELGSGVENSFVVVSQEK